MLFEKITFKPNTKYRSELLQLLKHFFAEIKIFIGPTPVSIKP